MRDNFSSSRYARTKKNKKQTLILNILIGIVFIGILAVGASMLIGDDESATEQSNQENSASVSDPNGQPDDSSNDENTDKQATGDEESKENEDKTDSESQKDEPSVKEEEDSSDSSSEDQEGYKTYKDETAGPDGDWEPVGTEQEGAHQSSFEKGTTDWKEKEKALQYATGLSPDEIEYWWIGNGGSPTTAKGIVSTAAEKDNPYVVMLEWVEGEGWKPTSVTREPGAAN
ncbi:YrrS family protein [Pseudalkalibacillus salsuginis]|uniref:YrrS family protein n=1 Tax=Pseudalkalibacillus salsuginis TaxID=2910972 RepID=UPI001F37ECCD|nr:YrrS family protein [Pseudalkalibacillus salsuginis]MCF6408601.1 YrrS family protein [Pseudalkalibacillus salsuginis]